MMIGQNEILPERPLILKAVLLLLPAMILFNPLLFASHEIKPEKNVLVLYSFAPMMPATYQWDRGIRSVFDAETKNHINVIIEHLDLSRFNDDRYIQMINDVFRNNYLESKPDLLITVYEPAFDFVLRYGQDLFRGVPIVFSGVERRFTLSEDLRPNMTGVFQGNTYAETLELAINLHPDTRRIVVVSGTGLFNQSWVMAAREVYHRYEDRLEFTYLIGLSVEELQDKLAKLPAETAVIYLPVHKDSAGKAYIANQVLSQISEVSSAPIYSFWDISLGRGMVGGYLSSFEAQEKTVAEMGLRVLAGHQTDNMPLIQTTGLKYMFDWRQLKRWSIPEDRLPPGSIVKFKELTDWERYKGRIIGITTMIVAQLLIIVYLLHQRRIRRRAEWQLEKAHDELEGRVAERTQQLEIQTAELAKAKESAEAANKAKSDFLASMSHELRTPLNTILGTGQIMSRDTDFPEKYKDNLGILSRSGEYLLSLVNDVLEISRIEAGRVDLAKSVFSLKNTLITIAEMTHLRIKEKGLELEVDYDPNIPENIRTDKAKFHQILNNLLDNAIKFTQKGGIVFRVRVVNSSGKGEIRVNQHEPADRAADKSSIINLRFIIEDTGIGISQDMQKDIFDHFVQVSTPEESIRGVGLGLTICSQYASLLGGSISVKSQPGKGSTFTVELPVEPVDESLIFSEATKRRVVGLAPDQPMFNILIVEDDVNSRIVLRQLLEQVGFSVLEAKDGRQAVENYERMQPDFIWMDIRLPVMDGMEAIRRIRELELIENDSSKHIPIIALSASVFEEDREEVLEAGCDDFVRKPYHENDIFDKMAQYLDISYIYQDIQPSEEKPVTKALTSADLADLPKDLVQRINEAAKGAASKKLLDLLQQIPPDFVHVAEALADLVSQYQFSTIIALTEKEEKDG